MKDIFNRIRNFNLAPWLVIFYSVGVAGMIIPQTRELFKAMVPLNLLLNVMLLLIYHGRLDMRFAWKALVIYSGGFIVEIAGVNTGLIFGSYEYGPTLGPQLFHTPLIIGVNWLMLVYASLVITSRFIEKRYFRVLVAAVLMVVYDFALEPAAIDLDMWDWGGPVPMQNYIAWLVISLVLVWFADRTGFVNRENKIAAPLFFVQLGFFILLDIWMYAKVIWGF
ncbi:MAG: carotenoid biosynthesis protein [Bacteroidales bacterium]|nr:carotenoid biosynthesis protein [Bacteroidales bacterium]MDT8432996.1 carotenoid biosynthesis protein [Bacteroidales bacterium]